jgi:Zn-dependent peptidase ImmA (M78 family)
VAYRRGFKTEANNLADELRRELKLGPLDCLDPQALAELLKIPILDLSDLAAESPALLHLLNVEPDVFSAVTVFRGWKRTIVHNDAHALVRQNSNLAHELSHGVLGHPPTAALDDRGCRHWNQGVEDEASWLAGILLVPEAATIEIVRRGLDLRSAGEHFGVSTKMIQFRLNATGAVKRVQRMRRAV